MRIGEIIKLYREEHGETQRSMGKKLNVSHAYIAMLEQGENPTTGKEPAPSIYFFVDLARLMGKSVDELLHMMDGNQPITIPPRNKGKEELLHLIENLPEDKLGEAINYLSYLSQAQNRAAKGA